MPRDSHPSAIEAMTQSDQRSARQCGRRWTLGISRALAGAAVALGVQTHVLRAQSTAVPDTLSAPRIVPSVPAGPPADAPPPADPESAVPNATAVSVPASTLGRGQPFPRLAYPNILTDTGTHIYALSPDESDDVRAAIEHAIAHMNFIVRPIARRRLIRANRPAPMLTFEVRPDTLAVTFPGLNPIITPLTGDTVPWLRGSTGETYAVHVVLAGDTLRQTIASDDGERENDFIFLDAGATIEMHVTLKADRLPAPLQYVEVFREIRSQPDGSPP
jgi:hypothetical protein